METFSLQPEGGLLQSSQWMAVMRAEGRNVVDINVGVQSAHGIVQRLPIVGSYLYFPRLCAVSYEIQKQMIALPYAWIRVDVCDEAMLHVIRENGAIVRKAPHDMQPRTNMIIKITDHEDALLSQMKSKTRYNIRLAQKKGVTVRVGTTQDDVDIFYTLVQETEKRKDIGFHEKEHYESILRILGQDHVAIYSAVYDNVIIAANIVSFYNGVATYLHGATSDVHRTVMAPFLLQWMIMCDAKKRGCMWYDLGGVFPESNDVGKGGITRFKSGFAPQERYYDTKGSYDIVLSSWRYRLYHVMRTMSSL